MKFSILSTAALLAAPAAAEIYFKEQFNDEVRGSLLLFKVLNLDIQNYILRLFIALVE
jgi:hypothetical protein